MGKYAEAIGVWNHTIENITNKIVPQMGDNERIGNAMSQMKKDKDTAAMLKNIGKIYGDFVERADPTMIEEDKKEMRTWVELNQVQIMKDMLIEFKWSTKEQFDKFDDLGEEEIKKLLGKEA